MDGRPLLLLHGFPEFWWGWRKQIDALASDGFRVVVPTCAGMAQATLPKGWKPIVAHGSSMT